MPLFGKKKTDQQKVPPPASGAPSGVYPTASGAYPTASGGYPGAPPPYQPAAPAGHAHGAAPQYMPPQGYPNAYPTYPQQGMAYNPAVHHPPTGYFPQQPPAGGVRPQVVGYGQFDPGARFGTGATVNVPPPPPGFMPNAAQMAAMQGGQAVMSQQKDGFFECKSGGGYTLW